ncbi:MAG: HD domain-containing protein [Oscillospiraceae bacterium]|nr:HD domain-containing protein [Oscillospiraceae bacterium]
MTDMETAYALAEAVHAHGGCAYFVGGFVRDKLLGIDNKDIDIEVHGITPAQLEDILHTIGEPTAFGESFGVFGLKGCDIDIAMPRKETLRGQGHKDFDIFVDPFIGTEAAARRRDFTVNALMQNVLTGEVIDRYGGAADLRAGILRHVSDESFPEDPLRVLRGAQFAARFDLTPAPETVRLCRTMNLHHLPSERIEAELKKALLKAERPSVFFTVLREMQQLDIWFPELKALIGQEQHPTYHAEGDVWNHTMMVLDEAAKLRNRVQQPYPFMLSALCHDFGKAVSSEAASDGAVHAYGHETAGLPLVKQFLSRITKETKVIDYVLNMTQLHMRPNIAAHNGASVKSTNKLFDEALVPRDLICLALADDRGRISLKPAPSTEVFLMERVAVYEEYLARPYVMGKDLIAAGLTPGKDFSDILAYAHKLRLAGVPKDSALKQTLSYARKIRK